MILNLDINKSIKEKRVVPSSRITYFSDFIMFAIFALAFLIGIIKILCDSNFLVNLQSIIIITICILIFTIVFIQIYNMDKLTYFSDKKGLVSHEIVYNIVNENKWFIEEYKKEMIIIRTDKKLHNERQLTIIFCNNFLLLNVMSFGFFDNKLPFSSASNGEILEHFIDTLNKKINNAT
jgi:hypothetical protein